MKQVGGKDWQEWYPLVCNGLLNPEQKRGKEGNWPAPMCRHFNTALPIICRCPTAHAERQAVMLKLRLPSRLSSQWICGICKPLARKVS
jgi:hypothetical protein